MRRQIRALHLPLAEPAVPATGDLRVRVAPDGQVRASRPKGGRFSTPPHLVARIGPGPVLEGTIRESYAEVFFPRLYLAAAAGLAAFGAALLPTHGPGVPICGIGAGALGLLGLALGRLRRYSFRIGADRLEQTIRKAARPAAS